MSAPDEFSKITAGISGESPASFGDMLMDLPKGVAALFLLQQEVKGLEAAADEAEARGLLRPHVPAWSEVNAAVQDLNGPGGLLSDAVALVARRVRTHGDPARPVTQEGPAQ